MAVQAPAPALANEQFTLRSVESMTIVDIPGAHLQLREYTKARANLDCTTVRAHDTWTAALRENGMVSAICVHGLPDDAEFELVIDGLSVGFSTMHVLTWPLANDNDDSHNNNDNCNTLRMVNTYFPNDVKYVNQTYGSLSGKKVQLLAVQPTRFPYIFTTPRNLTMSMRKLGVFQGPSTTTWAAVDGCE